MKAIRSDKLLAGLVACVCVAGLVFSVIGQGTVLEGGGGSTAHVAGDVYSGTGGITVTKSGNTVTIDGSAASTNGAASATFWNIPYEDSNAVLNGTLALSNRVTMIGLVQVSGTQTNTGTLTVDGDLNTSNATLRGMVNVSGVQSNTANQASLANVILGDNVADTLTINGTVTATNGILITSGGLTTISNIVNVAGVQSNTAAIVAVGNVTLGDNVADTITIHGTATFTNSVTVNPGSVSAEAAYIASWASGADHAIFAATNRNTATGYGVLHRASTGQLILNGSASPGLVFKLDDVRQGYADSSGWNLEKPVTLTSSINYTSNTASWVVNKSVPPPFFEVFTNSSRRMKIYATAQLFLADNDNADVALISLNAGESTTNVFAAKSFIVGTAATGPIVGLTNTVEIVGLVNPGDHYYWTNKVDGAGRVTLLTNGTFVGTVYREVFE